jgi:hypothetical protein
MIYMFCFWCPLVVKGSRWGFGIVLVNGLVVCTSDRVSSFSSVQVVLCGIFPYN